MENSQLEYDDSLNHQDEGSEPDWDDHKRAKKKTHYLETNRRFDNGRCF